MARSKGEWWSESKRIECVTKWLVYGSAALVSADTGVPAGTIRQWKTQPWWKEYQAEIQTETDQQVDSKLHRVVERSLEQVMDRLENGDFMYNPKTGEFSRTPMKGRDIAKIANDALDKRMLIRKNSPAEAVNAEAVGDILKNLAKEFADMAKKRVQNGTVTQQESAPGVRSGPEINPEGRLHEGTSGGDSSLQDPLGEQGGSQSQPPSQ